MATKQLTSLDGYVLPRVNLLPPEIAAKKAEQRSYVLMGLAVAGAGAAVVALYMGQAAKVSAAKKELAASQTTNAQLKAKRDGLQSVQNVYAEVDAQEALLTTAFSNRILWSVQLHNLSIGMPENVWITQFSGTSATGGTGGSMTYAGKAFAYNDIAAWLESMSRLKGVADASFSTATKTKSTVPGARPIVTFASTASLTPDAITPHKKPGSR
jgi:Tfp pilus assembly protein PilN